MASLHVVLLQVAVSKNLWTPLSEDFRPLLPVSFQSAQEQITTDLAA